MPLYKRKPLSLLPVPTDLDPKEHVFQVRFTKEIFRNYQEYLNRINLYRERVWTCRYTGKSNLTYEEAWVSERRANEKVRQFPPEIIPPILRIIQYSMLPLKDLADAIAMKLQDHLFPGFELHGKKEGGEFPCRVLKVLDDGAGKSQYEIAWLGEDKEDLRSAVVTREDLVMKKFPFSRNILKTFIRESTYRSAPWVLHVKLAEKHGITNNLPEELKGKFSIHDGILVSQENKKRKGDSDKVVGENQKKQKLEGKALEGPGLDGNSSEDDKTRVEVIKYPIEDLLVMPGPDDPVFTDRPSPSRDFKISMKSVGDLLMVWDFCTSFGRLLRLWPFSLGDLENAICHKDSNLTLIVEAHSALLRLLIKGNGDYSSALETKRRKHKITLINWTEYLCDFLDMAEIHELRAYISTIKRGHYGLLEVNAKLEIFRELVNYALETNMLREQLDKYIEQWHELGANKREAALEEGRKRREEKERFKAERMMANGVSEEHEAKLSEKDAAPVSANGDHGIANGGHSIPNGEIELEKAIPALKKRETSYADESVALNKKTKKLSENGHIKIQDLSKNKVATIAVEHSRVEQRKQHYEREMEKRFIRTNPLGRDKHYNRYWWFRRDGRIFIESSDHELWGCYNTKEEVDALMGSLNCKGERERALKKQLEKFYDRISSGLQKRSKEAAENIALEEGVLRRSTRVRAPPRDNPANAYLRYVNKWRED